MRSASDVARESRMELPGASAARSPTSHRCVADWLASAVRRSAFARQGSRFPHRHTARSAAWDASRTGGFVTGSPRGFGSALDSVGFGKHVLIHSRVDLHRGGKLGILPGDIDGQPIRLIIVDEHDSAPPRQQTGGIGRRQAVGIHAVQPVITDQIQTIAGIRRDGDQSRGLCHVEKLHRTEILRS